MQTTQAEGEGPGHRITLRAAVSAIGTFLAGGPIAWADRWIPSSTKTVSMLLIATALTALYLARSLSGQREEIREAVAGRVDINDSHELIAAQALRRTTDRFEPAAAVAAWAACGWALLDLPGPRVATTAFYLSAAVLMWIAQASQALQFARFGITPLSELIRGRQAMGSTVGELLDTGTGTEAAARAREEDTRHNRRLIPAAALGLIGALLTMSVAGASGALDEPEKGRPPTEEPGSGDADNEPPILEGTDHGTDAPGEGVPALPTYEDLCGRSPEAQPGFGIADEELRQAVHDLWLADDGVGGLIAGCTIPATTVSDGNIVVNVQRGFDGAQLKSVALTGPDRRAHLLVGFAAEFAVDLIDRGVVVWTSGRVDAGHGDVILLVNHDGVWALARSEKVRDRQGAPYAVLSPTATARWVQWMLDNAEWSWPIPAGSDGFNVTDSGGVVTTIPDTPSPSSEAPPQQQVQVILKLAPPAPTP